MSTCDFLQACDFFIHLRSSFRSQAAIRFQFPLTIAFKLRLFQFLQDCVLQEEKEQLARKAAEREKLHGEYENLLKEAEHRLSTLPVSKPVNCQISRNSEDLDDEVDEEVVRILQKSNQTDLDTVDLKGRMLRVILEAIGRLSTLKVLDLSWNRLETLPDSIAGLTSLEKLFLSANILVSLPDSIGLLIHLQILNVSANRLKALPDSLSQCRALLELDASFNELTFLPTRLGFELTSLEILDVHLNKLSTIIYM